MATPFSPTCKIIIAPKTIIDIKVYHLPLGHIVHFQLFGKL
jgi:hypothetical protein